MQVLILGTRGVPAKHGGFETFAENLARFLTARDHQVTVYCQSSAHRTQQIDSWEGIRRVLIPAGESALGTIRFDISAVCHSLHQQGVILTLGYNTGILNFLYRLHSIPSIMNMDGIEWRRDKWSKSQRAWLWFNEWAGAWAANHLIADHPEIATHLARHTSPEKISMIPYGADAITSAPVHLIQQYGLSPKSYYILIARPEPENSAKEIVQAYSSKTRGLPLIVLGSYKPESNDYHAQVITAANEEVRFLGAIYDRNIVRALRFHAKAYIHGHRVGGTNPSLVESLAAGNPVIAHDNPFNRWVAGKGARFFRVTADLANILDLLEHESALLERMAATSRQRHQESFTQEKVLLAYEHLLLNFARASPVTQEEFQVVREL